MNFITENWKNGYKLQHFGAKLKSVNGKTDFYFMSNTAVARKLKMRQCHEVLMRASVTDEAPWQLTRIGLGILKEF